MYFVYSDNRILISSELAIFWGSHVYYMGAGVVVYLFHCVQQ